MNAYRKELKYIVGDDVLFDVKNRINGLMRKDRHQQGDHYRIRSVYFDSPDLCCYRENLAGVSPREKYRLRTYDMSDNVINAEIKIRHRDTITKMSTVISRELFDTLMSGGSPRDLLTGEMSRTLEKYAVRILSQKYKKVCIVDYERSAFVYEPCNVRITLDRNITASREFCKMFEPDLAGIPVIDGGRHILEIKYDEFLPGEIKDVLGGLALERCSSSKYVLSMNRLI